MSSSRFQGSGATNAGGDDLGVRVLPFIDGVAIESAGAGCIDVIDPSSGRLRFTIPKGSTNDVDRAVDAARRAFDDGRWRDASPSHKKRVLRRFAELTASCAPQLNALDAEEMGKPVSERFCDGLAAAALVDYFAEAVDKVGGDVFCSDKGSFIAQRFIPRGVVAALTPWNFPAFCCALKVAPALAGGNSVVLKPSELSSRSAILMAHLAMDAGVPPGVLNVVPGDGRTVGSALGLHMDVDMVTFTGSTGVGKLMMQYAGQSNLKVVMAECGGKSPQIVFRDCGDIDSTCVAIAHKLVTNQGQICSVGSRVLVERSIEETVVEKIVSEVKKIVMGNSLDPKTTFGPLASDVQCQRVLRYIESGLEGGAALVTGGRRALDESKGFFVEPTVFRRVTPASRLAQEEVFGPVLSIIPFDDEREAVSIANNTIYGLVAYVWTSDLSKAMRLARGIKSSVRLNAAVPEGDGGGFAVSSEPAGQSGIGAEGGLAGLQSYMRRQTLTFSYA